MKKKAVVLFNLGGPDSLESVKPFLFNLFYDPAIIALPNPFRWFLAKFISKKREKEATEIYGQLGGKSPILEQTYNQAKTLEKELNSEKTTNYKVFTVMRYWHPRAEEIVKEVRSYNPDEIILLPLYPQYSTTTAASSIAEWKKSVKDFYPTKIICCYPELDGFIKPIAKAIDEAIKKMKPYGKVRVLFTAHGLPKKIIEKGDPYKYQVEKTVSSIKKQMSCLKDVSTVTCYQSRVGPLEWIKPYTDEEIKKAGKEKVSVIVVPIAFVSEHSETLVELDIEYRELAKKEGVPYYSRIPTIQCNPMFIKALKKLIIENNETPCYACSEKNKCCFKNTLDKSKYFSVLT